MATKLDLKPAAALKCSGCGRKNALSGQDGDTIHMRNQIPDTKLIARGLASVERRPLLLCKSRSVRLWQVQSSVLFGES